MRLHSFVPGLAPKKPQGSRFEPGHRQKVRIHLDGGWLDGVYNRETARFWVRSPSGWDELPDAVEFWTQAQVLPVADPEVSLDVDTYRSRRRRWAKIAEESPCISTCTGVSSSHARAY